MKTILLIDDEEDIREVAALTLETMGDFRVFAAANGFEGIELAAAMQPDAVLLDVMMPDIDGPTTLVLMREREITRDIPVIFMTAKVQASDRRSLSSMGVSGIISKPFDPMNLAEEVNDILKRHSERSGGPSSGSDKWPAASDSNAVDVDHLETIQARKMSCEVLAACGFSKEAFLENLDERLRSLNAALETIIDTSGKPLETVVREFHSLAGIAGTYDFPDVSELARRGEQLLQCALSEGTVRAEDVAAAKVLVREMDALRLSAVV